MTNPYDEMTAEQLPSSYSGADAQTFVESYLDFPLKGTSGLTLRSYVNTHQPSYGVIVNPFPDIDVLVWYDYMGNLHVVEKVPPVVSDQIAKPEYHSNEESFLYNLAQQTVNAGRGLMDWTTYALIGGAILLLIVYSPQIKSFFK